MGSVLVNGSPTKEFTFLSWVTLRRSPISVPVYSGYGSASFFMKSIDQGFFSGISTRSGDPIQLCHLFYADDAVFYWRME